MARPEITGRAPAGVAPSRKRVPRNRGPPSLAFTIQEFCDAHRISRAHYYNMKRLSLGPVESDAGGVIIITAESAARWREDREKAASGKSDDDDEDLPLPGAGRPNEPTHLTLCRISQAA